MMRRMDIGTLNEINYWLRIVLAAVEVVLLAVLIRNAFLYPAASKREVIGQGIGVIILTVALVLATIHSPSGSTSSDAPQSSGVGGSS